MDAEVATIRALSPSFSLARPISPQWRDVEEQWNLRRLILTLFYYSPSLASELSRISMALHSLSWWKDSCAAESLFTPRPRRPPECTRSPFTSMLTSEPSKINQKTGWCKPFVNLMFAGTFWNHLLNQKKKKKGVIFKIGSALKPTRDDDILASVAETVYSDVHCLPFVLFQPAWIFTSFTHRETIWSPLRMLICTSINSYLKDKSKHVCFLFVFFSPSLLPKGIYEHFGNKDPSRI